MTTATTIITSALQEIGVLGDGETLSASDAAMALSRLNMIVSGWITEPNYQFTTTTVTATLTAGVQSATIGPAMTFNCPRPVRLEGGCYVRANGLDYPLQVVTQEEYNAVPLKSISGPWPQMVYYDRGFPTGICYFYPTGPCTVYLNIQTLFAVFADLATSYTFPPGYERAYTLTLAEEMAPTFTRQINPMTQRNAHNARRMVKRANFSVPQLNYGAAPLVGIPPIY